MCIKIKTPKLPPERDIVGKEEAAKTSLARQQRERAAAAKGVFSNIFTSARGDPGFDTSTRTSSHVFG